MTLLDLARLVIAHPGHAVRHVVRWNQAGSQGEPAGHGLWLCLCDRGERLNGPVSTQCGDCGCTEPKPKSCACEGKTCK